MLTMADEGGRGGLDHPFLADIICEQVNFCSFLLNTIPGIIARALFFAIFL